MQDKSSIFHNFSERVKDLRWRVRKTQEEFGELLDVTGTYVYMLEANRKPGNYKLLRKVESLEALIRESEESKAKLPASVSEIKAAMSQSRGVETSTKTKRESSEQMRHAGVPNKTHSPITEGRRMKYPSVEEVGGSYMIVHEKIEAAKKELERLADADPTKANEIANVVINYGKTVRKTKKAKT